VVAAAVILPVDFDLTDIRDSKVLTVHRREESYERIISGATAVGVGIVEPETIDRINILQATFEAMRIALSDMGVPHDYVLVDGDKTIPRIFIDQKAIIGGDGKCASIAAASIVAKVRRDCIMAELAVQYPEYGFEKHKGYCTPEHLSAIEEHGVCRVHRMSFAPVARKAGEEDCLQKGLF
jgi:ribonuclease HII